MRARQMLGALPLAAAAIAAAALGAGCGSSFKLPTERLENRAAPSDGSYQMIATWTGLTGVTDALLIPGPQFYLAFRGNPGRVVEYSSVTPTPIATGRFQGVRNPAALAASPASVFVLDQGDTAAARGPGLPVTELELDCNGIPVPMTNPQAGTNWRIILNLPEYWYVREYDLKGRNLKSQFSDTTFAWVNGIAADVLGRVYVAGVIRYCAVNPFDNTGTLRTLEHRFRIYRYVRGTDDRYVVDSLATWQRDRSFEIEEGTGIGSTLDPRGMTWSAVTGEALFFADLGNDEAQKYDVFENLGNSYKLGFCDSDTLPELIAPLDVGVDDQGFVYVVDAGNRRVLRYAGEASEDYALGECVQRVDIEPNTLGLPLTAPLAVASGTIDGDNYVYVVDGAVNQVIRYRKRR